MKARKLILTVVVSFALLALAACGATDAPDKTAQGYAEALLSLDGEKAGEYTAAEGEALTLFADDVTKDMAQAVAEVTTLESVKVDSEDESAASVTLTVKGPDVAKLQEESMDKILELYFSDPSKSEKELNQSMAQSFIDSLAAAETANRETTVQVVKEGDQWLLPTEAQTAIYDLLFANIGPVELLNQ